MLNGTKTMELIENLIVDPGFIFGSVKEFLYQQSRKTAAELNCEDSFDRTVAQLTGTVKAAVLTAGCQSSSRYQPDWLKKGLRNQDWKLSQQSGGFGGPGSSAIVTTITRPDEQSATLRDMFALRKACVTAHLSEHTNKASISFGPK